MVFLRSILDLSQDEISHQTGFKRTTWNGYETGSSRPNLKDFVTIAEFFGIPEDDLLHQDLRKHYNAGNLILDKGVFKKHKNSNLNSNLKGNLTPKKYPKTEVLTVVEDGGSDYVSRIMMPQVITVDTQGNENVVMVPVKARAGYLNGYADPEFMASLPAYRLPGLNNGTFRIFEVEGLSMYPTLSSGDLVICSNVDQLGIVRDDRLYVVVTKTDGIVVKRVLNRIKSDGKLILKSDNYKDRDLYPPIVCDPQDIIEIWYATGFISRQMRPPAEMYNRLIDLEGRFTLLEDMVKKSGQK